MNDERMFYVRNSTFIFWRDVLADGNLWCRIIPDRLENKTCKCFQYWLWINFWEKMKWKFLVSEICKMINKSNVRCNGYLFYFKLLLGYWRWRKTTFIQTQIKFNTYSLLFSLLFIFHSTMQHSLNYTLSIGITLLK